MQYGLLQNVPVRVSKQHQGAAECPSLQMSRTQLATAGAAGWTRRASEAPSNLNPSVTWCV